MNITGGGFGVDIVRFKGGLGNQMFQYALLKVLSEKGREAKASLGFYDKNPQMAAFCLNDVFTGISFDIVDERIFEEKNVQWRKIKENERELQYFLCNYANRFFWVEELEGTYDEHIYETKNCVFVGYWQTEKYFYNIKELLMRDFTFQYGEDNLIKLRDKFVKNGQMVAIHVRRGDYLNSADIYGSLWETQYYEIAMRYFTEKLSKPKFVFFSDDIDWVKKKYCYKDCIYIESSMFEHYQPWYDMYLMSVCAHNIIANSSFSWWGAWLNRNKGQIVVAPRQWIMTQEMPDICPDRWLRM